jgi:hypothetical protein
LKENLSSLPILSCGTAGTQSETCGIFLEQKELQSVPNVEFLTTEEKLKNTKADNV